MLAKLGFWQRCCWRFRSSGMLSCVVVWVDPGVSKGCGAFETSGTASPTRLHYSPGRVFRMTYCEYETSSAVVDCAAQLLFNFHLFWPGVAVICTLSRWIIKSHTISSLLRCLYEKVKKIHTKFEDTNISLRRMLWCHIKTESNCLYRQVWHSIVLLSVHTFYLCVLCGSEKKQRLFPYTALTCCFS